MNKFAKILTSILLVVVLALTLTGCSSYGKVEKALKNIGYTAIESSDDADKIKGESEIAVTVHALTNKDSLSITEVAKINVVVVLEFKETKEMKDFYEDSDTLKGLVKDIKDDGTAEDFYNKLVEKGFAKGNCLIISINPIATSDVCDAIKNA